MDYALPSSSNPHMATQPPRVFHIPRQQILADNRFAHKCSSVTDENGLVKACVLVDVPQIPGRPQEMTRAFYGEPKGDLDSAAELALRHLTDEYGFGIVDFNYSAMVEYREKLRIAQECSLKMDAEIEAKQTEAIRYRQQRDGMVEKLKDVCIEFAGVLPVRAGGPCGVEYVGPPSPTGGYDKLALDLVQILQSVYVEKLWTHLQWLFPA